MVVKIYIESTPNNWMLLDLFQDESIQLNYKLKDMADISKVFSAFTQEFNIPASDNNNKALRHFFKTEVVRSRNRTFPCKIEIKGALFKVGDLQVLEGARANFKLRNYKCRFSTSVSQMKERIGDDVISNLIGDDLNETAMEWSDSGVYDKLVNGLVGDEMLVPLISTHRTWSYGTTLPNDIGNANNAITKNELKPAIKVKTVLQKLLDIYGFKVVSPLFDRQEFERLYMWLNSKVENNSSTAQLIFSQPFNPYLGSSPYFFSVTPTTEGYIRVTDTGASYNSGRTFVFVPELLNIIDPQTNATYNKSAKLKITQIETGATQTVDGNIWGTTMQFNFSIGQEQAGTVRTYKLEVEFEDSISFSSVYCTTSATLAFSLGLSQNALLSTNNLGFTPSVKFNIKFALGEFKVIDFFSSIFKMFNIRVVEDDVSGLMYWYTPDDFKATGKRFDLNKYINVKDYSLQPSTNYKTFTFTHKPAPYYRNVVYKQEVGKEYGAEIYDSGNQNLTENYTLETNLNILNYFKVDGTMNLLTSYGFDEKQSPVIAKEMTFLYAEEFQIIRNEEDTMNANIRFKTPVIGNPNGTNQLARYVKFSNRNGTINDYTNTLTFDIDIDPISMRPMTKSLYANYYKQDIDRLYYDNSNYFTFDGFLTTSAIMNFNMADELIIEDRLFTIEEANLDLTTGRIKMKLLNVVDLFGAVNQVGQVVNAPEILTFNATGGWLKINGIIVGAHDPVYPIVNFEIEYRRNGTSNWISFPWGYTPFTSQVWFRNNVQAGTYTVRGRAKNTAGNYSPWMVVNNVIVGGAVGIPVEIDDLIKYDPCKTFPPVKGQIGIKDGFLPVKNIRDFKIGDEIFLNAEMTIPYRPAIEKVVQIGSLKGDYVLSTVVAPSGKVKDLLPCGFRPVKVDIIKQPVSTVQGACTLFDSSAPKSIAYTAGGFKVNSVLFEDEDMMRPLVLESESFYGVRIEGQTEYRAVKLSRGGEVKELAQLCGELPPIEVKALSIDTRSISNTPYSSCSRFIEGNLTAYVENFEVGATIYEDINLNNPLPSFDNQYVSLVNPLGYVSNIRMSADSTIDEIASCDDITPTLMLQVSEPQDNIQDSCNLINEYPNILYAKSFSEGNYLYENPELTIVSEFGEGSLLGISFQGKKFNILKQDGKITNLIDCSVFNVVRYIEVSNISTTFEMSLTACERAQSLVGTTNQRLYFRGELEEDTQLFYESGLTEVVTFPNNGYIPFYDRVRERTGNVLVASGQNRILTYNNC